MSPLRAPVHIVIPAFNKSELTHRCLSSLFALNQSYSAVYVVNNGSTDATVQVLELFPQVQVIENPSNLGFGRACNQGIRPAWENPSAEWIAVLNNDTWLMPGWAPALIAAAERAQLDCVGPFFDERPLAGAGDERPRQRVDETAELTARALEFLGAQRRPRLRSHFVPMLMFWRASSLARLKLVHGGVFDERFFVTYEDTDLLHRARALGLRWGETNQCYMWHASRATRGDQKLLPSGYEQEGLNIFIEKWGFDPRSADHTLGAKLQRRWREGRRRQGRF